MSDDSNMSRRRRNARAEGAADYVAKRSQIIQAAATLFKERGYSATRLVDIARVAGLDRATIYYYVGSKEEMFRDAIEDMLTRNLEGATAIAANECWSVRERLTRVIQLLMTSYAENYPQLYVYIEEVMHSISREDTPWSRAVIKKTLDFEAVVRRLIDEGMKSGELRATMSSAMASFGLFGMINWTHRWFTPDGSTPARELADDFASIFFEGMSTS